MPKDEKYQKSNLIDNGRINYDSMDTKNLKKHVKNIRNDLMQKWEKPDIKEKCEKEELDDDIMDLKHSINLKIKFSYDDDSSERQKDSSPLKESTDSSRDLDLSHNLNHRVSTGKKNSVYTDKKKSKKESDFSEYDIYNDDIYFEDHGDSAKIVYFSIAPAAIILPIAFTVITLNFLLLLIIPLYIALPFVFRGIIYYRSPKSRRNRALLVNMETDEITDTNGSKSSLENAKKDYKEAMLRISSYETDISKAISYPAFNDVTVSEVSAMLKQLRKCERLLNDDNETNVNTIVSAVDELWIDIQAAERAAKKIAWSNVSIAEQKGLKLAENLIRQANDAGNTDEMRVSLYSKLKTVIDRLNANDDIVPVKVIAEIEDKAKYAIESLVVSSDTGVKRA